MLGNNEIGDEESRGKRPSSISGCTSCSITESTRGFSTRNSIRNLCYLVSNILCSHPKCEPTILYRVIATPPRPVPALNCYNFHRATSRFAVWASRHMEQSSYFYYTKTFSPALDSAAALIAQTLQTNESTKQSAFMETSVGDVVSTSLHRNVVWTPRDAWLTQLPRSAGRTFVSGRKAYFTSWPHNFTCWPSLVESRRKADGSLHLFFCAKLYEIKRKRIPAPGFMNIDD